MALRGRYSRRRRVENAGSATTFLEQDRVTCAVCGFAGQPLETPAANLGVKPTTVNGSTYVWTNSTDALSTLDKETIVQDQVGTCRFCHGERYFDGARGSGLRVP